MSEEFPTNLVELRFGRNVKGAPASEATWSQFRAEAAATLQGVADGLQRGTTRRLKQWVETHVGVGTWTDDETGETFQEESAVVTLYTDAADLDLGALLFDVAQDFAVRFQQDAVAFVLGGRSTLVRRPCVLCGFAERADDEHCAACDVELRLRFEQAEEVDAKVSADRDAEWAASERVCVECGRSFFLLDDDDCAEWYLGHDCEVRS